MDGFEVNLKHCRTCKVWRSPRSTHCDACDNCVEGFDHHCPWVGTCIGERNYFEFCWFIFSTSIVLIYCVGYSIYLIASDDGDLAHRTNKHWAAMICACYGFLFSIFIEILSACHCCLLCQGVTTKEWYDLCPRGPCDSWPGALSQFLCFGMLCSVCLKFQEYELRPEEGRHDPCDKICRCKLRGENRPSCCASWFRVCCRPLPKRGWSMTDRWADVFPHKVEWNHRDDNADERAKLGWQKVERRLRYTKLTRAEISKRIADGKEVPMDEYDPSADPTLQVGGWVPKEAGEAWSDDHFTPYPQDDWQMLKLHDKLPLTGIEADMLR